MSVKITTRGVERTLERLQQMGDTTRIEQALDAAASIVERDYVAHAPIDTGQTRAQAYVDKPDALTRVVGSDTPQSVYNEYSPRQLKGATVANPRRGPWPYERGGILRGTNPNATMPALRPALYRNRRRITGLIERAIGRRGS